MAIDQRSLNIAKAGNAKAQYELGLKYKYGSNGTRKNRKKAIEWLTEAADQGYVDAQCHLGLMYLGGHGVAKDYQKAFKWYTKAANQGNAEAQFALGSIYFKGKIVPKDSEKAIELYTKAANQGHAEAQVSLNAIKKSRQLHLQF